MKKALVVFVAVGLFLLFVLAKAPAWLLVDAVKGRLPGLVPGPASGSIWAGNIQALNYQQFALGDLAWRVRPAALVGGSPLAVSVGSPLQLKANLGVVDGQRLVLDKVSARGDIGPLLEASGLPTMGFSGNFSLLLDSATLGPRGCEAAAGQLIIADVQGDVPGIAELGTLAAKLSCSGGALQLTLDENNPARVRGTLTLSGNGRTRGQVMLSPPPGSELFLSLRDFLGAPRNGKDFVIRI